MRNGVFLQVRLASKRLPGKALLALKGANVLQHAMRALLPIGAEVNAVLTDSRSAEPLAAIAANEGFRIFIGSENDVLSRFAQAVKQFRVDNVLRATGDNPLVSALMGREILRIHEQERSDLSHYHDLPLGTGVEVISPEALLIADSEARDPFEREHITTFLYRNRQRFKVIEADCPVEFSLPDSKVSIDNEEEYIFVQKIYRDLYLDRPIEIDRLVGWLKSHKGETVEGKDSSGSCNDAGNGYRPPEKMCVPNRKAE